MKLRQGFVSNSSTTAFVAIGWIINDEQAMEYLKIVDPDVAKDVEFCDDDTIADPCEIDEEFLTYFHSESDDRNLKGSYVLGWYSTVGTDEAPVFRDASKLVEKVKEEGLKIGLKDPKLISDSVSC